MKAFVDWLLARRHRPILVAVAVMPVIPIVSAALTALETLRSGVSGTLPGAALGAGALVFLWLVVGPMLGLEETYAAVSSAVAVFSFAIGLGLGALLRWARGLALAFQGVVVICVAAVLLLNLFGPGGGELFTPVFDYVVETVSSQEGVTQEQIDAFREAQPLVLGLLAAGLLTALLMTLFLAYWLCGIAVGDTRFGEEFRSLRMSRVLGIPATVLVTVSLALGAPLVQNLTALALVGFLFQGLSVLHAWAHARRWHAAFIVPVYVMLVTPLLGLVVLALGAVGLMDNWFDLRAPLRPRT